MLNKSNFTIFFIYFYTFLFIFNPSNFFKFNLLYLLTIFSIGYLVFAKDIFLSFIENKRVFSLLFFCLYIITYLCVLYIGGAEDALYRSYVVLLTIMSILCGLAIVDMFRKIYGFNFYKFLEFIINIGLIQFVLVVLSVIFPDFRDWTLNTARQEDILSISNDEFGGLRSFGLASGYTSTLPMFMGVCSLLSFYLFIFNEKIRLKIFYFLVSFAFLFCVVVNARIGLVPMLIWILFSPIFFIYNIKKTGKTFLFLFLFLFSSMSFSFITLLNSVYFERLKMGLEDVSNLLGGHTSGNFEMLSYMWFFPNNLIDFVFGSGVDVFVLYSKGSDIGLIRDFYMYGLLNIIIMIVVLIYSSRPLFNILSKYFGFLFSLTFIFSFFLFYLKGMIFSSNEIMNLFFLLLIFCSLYRVNTVD